jgi:hypothetical protein
MIAALNIAIANKQALKPETGIVKLAFTSDPDPTEGKPATSGREARCRTIDTLHLSESLGLRSLCSSENLIRRSFEASLV